MLWADTLDEWCPCGSLESITDPLGRITSWVHDLQGRVTAKIYADSSQISYSYETNTSRLNSTIDAKNQATIYDYFVDNNLKQITYSNAVISTPNVAFTYDTNYNRLLTMTDGIGTTTNGYYPITIPPSLGAARLATVSGPLNASTIAYKYDELGRITNRSINGVEETMSFDALDRGTFSINALGSFTNAFVGATARISTNSYPNGQESVFNYYENAGDHRPQKTQHSIAGSAFSVFDYSYDPDGEITTWTQQVGGSTTNLWAIGYDP
jgi:YD repeat-containing protein